MIDRTTKHTTDLAIIRSADIVIDRGFILSFRIDLDYGGASQAFCGIILATESLLKEGESNGFAADVIYQLMSSMKVRQFSDLVGKIVWVERSNTKVHSLTAMKWEGGKTVCPHDIAMKWGLK